MHAIRPFMFALTLLTAVVPLASAHPEAKPSVPTTTGAAPVPPPARWFLANIRQTARDNHFYRRVVFTGPRQQLVVMSIPTGSEIGEEVHPHVGQVLSFVSGTGRAIVDGQTTPVGPGDVLIVTPSVRHNVVNDGDEPLKLYTVYAPPNHIDGRIHETKPDAEADADDEAFGRQAR